MKRRSSVEVSLIGGLGNQLFGYFAGSWLASRLDLNLRVNLSLVASEHTNGKFNISSFILSGDFKKGKYAQTELFINARRIRDSAQVRFPQIASQVNSYLGVYHDAGRGDFDPHLGDLSKGRIHLKGYFSSYEYFRRSESLNPTAPIKLKEPSDWYLAMQRRLSDERPISLHVRRGDYMNMSSSRGLLSREYYVEALNYLESTGLDGNLWIFSDDLKDAKRELAKLPKKFHPSFIEIPKGHDPAESMLLMTQAKANIVANSTFSGWGATLNPTSRIVIAPQTYFKDQREVSGYPPKEWHSIPSVWVK
jgi:hypothetical protein